MCNFFSRLGVLALFLLGLFSSQLVLSNPIENSSVFKSDRKKIVILTIPKGGTHLIKKAAALISGQKVAWIKPADILQFDPTVHLLKNETISISHLFPHLDIIKTVSSKDFIKIVLIRDPRDVFVSQVDWLARCKEWVWWVPQTLFDEFERLSYEEKLSYVIKDFPALYYNIPYFTRKAVEWMKDPSVFICRFEDLVGPEGGGNREQQEQTIKALATHMGYNLSRQSIEEIARQLYGGTLTFRNGQIGSWTFWFGSYHKQLLKEIMGQDLIDLGYVSDNNW